MISAHSPSADRLQSLEIFHHLPMPVLEAVARRLKVSLASPGSVILEPGLRTQTLFFLLQGRVRLTSAQPGCRESVLTSNDTKARLPLVSENPVERQVKAETSVVFLAVPKALLDEFKVGKLKDSKLDSPDSVVQLNVHENRVLTRLQKDIEEDRLFLPSLPDVAIRVGTAINHKYVDSDRVAQAVLADPAITAKLIKAANSPLYAGTQAVRTGKEAVVRLGINVTHRLVVSFTLRELFRSACKELQNRMQDLWSESRRVAALSALLAKHLGGFEVDLALLGGLIHGIGHVPVFAYFEEGTWDEDDEELDLMVRHLQAPVGQRVLKEWRFPQEIVDLPIEVTQWMRQGADKADYVDLVIAAKRLSYLEKNTGAKLPPLTAIPALNKLGLVGDDDQLVRELIAGAESEIAATEAMLGA